MPCYRLRCPRLHRRRHTRGFSVGPRATGKSWAVMISIDPSGRLAKHDRLAKLVATLGVTAHEDDKVITLDFGSGQKAGAVQRAIERIRLHGVHCRVERHEEY